MKFLKTFEEKSEDINILSLLAEKLVEFDNYEEYDEYDAVIFDNHEIDIDEKIIFVSGKIAYTWNESIGDYFTPSYTEREFYFADLNVKIFENLDDEDGKVLSEEELKKLYNLIEKFV
jgi:hypothetical protein